MYIKISTTIVLILVLSQYSNALFFGLFSSRPTKIPEVAVTESPKVQSDKQAYQNYLQSLASTYYATNNYLPHYMPVYTYQPQFTEFIKPQSSFVYPDTKVQETHQLVPVRVNYNYQPYQNTIQFPSAKFEKPITVLPYTSYQETSQSSPKTTRNMNKLIEESTSNTSDDESYKVKTIEFKIPEPKISASLHDLPLSDISPDFLTGGYLTKTMTVDSSPGSSTRSARKFGHAYTTQEGTKVSEEGQLVQYGNGQETVVKRGQYEYIDANGKQVLVKWIADDEGFRIVN